VLRVTLKGVRGHLVRFLLTAFAVTLGVAFVAGSYVLRDSINNTLNGLLDSATKGLDVSVRGKEPAKDAPRPALKIDLAAVLASVDGVARSSPDVQGQALIVGKDGLVVRNGGAPGLGFAFRSADPSFTLVAGRGPSGPGEIVVEQTTLKKSGLAVGDSTQALIGAEARTVQITGEVTFGSLFGATAVLVDEATARRAFAPDGSVPSISLTARPGTSQEVLRQRVAAMLPATAEAVTGKSIADENKSAVQTGLGFVTTFLLVFAGITLFVGGFIIVNTFSMLVAQRTRELALLRAVGASRAQVLRMVLGEAVVIGLVGSAVGLALGIGLASALKSLSKALLGVDITGGLPVSAGTVIRSLAVGTLVTVVAAVIPARRAARIAPVAAMRDDMVATPSSLRRRGSAGIAVLVVGAALLTWAVTRADPAWPVAGFGAAILVIGALVAAPLAARPVIRVIGAPFVAFGGVVGRLARENALRVPRRTATTASALMIGLALVSGTAVVAQSFKASIADLVQQQIKADFVLSTAGAGGVPVSVGPAAEQLNGVKSVATISGVQMAVGTIHGSASASTARGLADNVNLKMLSGALTALDRGQVLVNETTATKQHWSVGTPLTARVGPLGGQRLTVGGVFQDSQLIASEFVIDRSLYLKAVPAAQQLDNVVLLKIDPTADRAALRAALTGLVKPYLVVSVQDGTEFVNSAAQQIDQLLGLLYALLALSIVIAVLGIINTLALSVIERTREIGLLRAVGLRRGQLSGMITIESVATAVFGAVLGTVLGLALGTALQHGLRNSGLDVLDIPLATIVTVLIASAVAGIVAAALPALRAVRLNVLQAIATD
jgi:putative ABC transport system permease protein